MHLFRFLKLFGQESDDEDAGNVDIDKQIEMTFKSKKSVKETVVGADEQGESERISRQ